MWPGLEVDYERIVCSDQTHTTNVRVVTETDAGKGLVRPKDYTDVDGLITDVPGLTLATFFRRLCAPVFCGSGTSGDLAFPIPDGGEQWPVWEKPLWKP